MTPSRSPNRLSLPAPLTRTLLPMALVALGALMSCQSTTGPATPTTSNFNRSASLTLPPAFQPDSAVLERGGKPIGKASVAISGESVKLAFTLPSDMDKDTVWVRLWSHGLQFRSLAYAMVGGEPKLVNSSTTNDLATILLKRLDTVLTRDTSLHDERKALVELVGKAIATGDPKFQDWSHRLPGGLTVATADSAALAEIVRSGTPLEEASKVWSVTLDRGQILSLLETWVEWELISSEQRDVVTGGESADLTPPSVKFTRPSRDTTVGSTTDALEVAVTASDASGVDSVWIGSKVFTQAPFQTTLNLQAGKNTIQAIAIDRHGNRDSAVVSILRERDLQDSIAPTLARTGSTPRRDTTVASDVGTLELSWLVQDETSMGTVSLNGTTLEGNDSLYSVRADLSAGLNTLVLVALDKAGNARTDTLRVTREADSDAPALAIVLPTPSADTSVGNSVAKVLVRANASDAGGIDSVRIGTRVFTSAPFEDSVALVVGENRIVADAWDKAGNHSSDTLVIRRERAAGDSTPPTVERLAPLGDTSVGWGVTRLGLKWKVSDASGLGSVRVGDVSLTSDNDVYGSEFDLVEGLNTFVLQAVDNNGNARTDTLKITRAEDRQAPSVRITAPASDTTVESETATIVVRVSASDENGMDSVKIGNRLLRQAPFQDTLVLSVGANSVVAIGWDKAGNSTSDTLVITRKRSQGDTTRPTIVRESPAHDSTVPWSTTSVHLRWLIQDDSALASVQVGAQTLTGSDNRFEGDFPLAVGENVFSVKAVDAKGNAQTDTIRVTRTADRKAPALGLVSPGKDTTVPHGTASLTVEVSATDLNGIDSVQIGGKTVVASPFKTSVALQVGTNALTISAWDKAGNRADTTLVITRTSKDSVKPVISRATGASNRTIFYDSSFTTLSWKVVDDIRLREVRINDVVVKGSSDLFTITTPPLRVGPNGFKIVATDSTGNQASDSVTIVRAWADTIAPVIARSTGTGPKSIAYEDSVYTPSWKVTDTLLKSVSIQSKAVTGSSDLFSAKIALPLGKTFIKIVATDLAGNTSTDTFTVVRQLGVIPALSISHEAGSHDSVLHVTIQSKVADASIRYTLDGTDPSTSATALSYSSVVLIDQTRVLKAVATAPDHTPSPVATRDYSLILPSPVGTLPSGTRRDTAFSVDLSCRVTGAVMYYTLDGSTPTEKSTRYYGGINSSILIDSLRVLKVVAIKSGWTNSPVATLKYNANVPVRVVTTMNATAVIRADGSLWTTGRGVDLMDGSSGERAEFAKVMDSVLDVTEVHILRRNGDLYAYGTNDSGQFGNGTNVGSTKPVLVRTGVKKVQDGRTFSLILDNANVLYATGTNTTGAFCNGTFTSTNKYTQIRTGVADISAGYQGTPYGNSMWSLFVTTSGDAFSCGSGPLGNGSSSQTKISTPKLIGSGVATVYAADGGYRQSPGSYYVKTTGEAFSTGYNTTGYLISITYPSAADTTFVPVRKNVVMVAGAYEVIFMLDKSGTLWGSGLNMSGEVGAGTSNSVKPPVSVATDVKFIATSGSNSYLIKKNGTLWAAGYNNGYFGDGSTTASNTFVQVKLP